MIPVTTHKQMLTTPEQMHARLAVLLPSSIEIIDDSALHAGHAGAKSGGGHFRLTIISPEFAGKATMARHRMVYDALGSLMQHQIHALSITAKTPEQL